MSVTFTKTERRGPSTWYFQWTSSLETPTYYIYLDGVLASITQETSYQLDVSTGMVAFEVLDSSSELPTEVYPGRAFMSWQTNGEVGVYSVEEYVDSEWVTRATLRSTGLNTLTFTSRYLEDDTSHQFRLTPQDDASLIDGTARTLTFLMVRKPDVPAVSYSLNTDTRVVTISDAS